MPKNPVIKRAPSSKKTLTREDWIAGARRALVQSGVDEVKVNRLARKLKMTRGSFYHHFTGHQDLLDALLHDWEARNRAEIEHIRRRWSDVEPDLSEVIAIWLGEDPGFLAFDTAIRSWARKSNVVDAAVHRLDAAWISLLEDLFRQSDYSLEESLVRARIVYFHQIGYYALSMRETLEERLTLVPFYYEVLTGKKPGTGLDAVMQTFRTRPPTGRRKQK